MSTNSKSEVARCASPLTKTINRLSYYTKLKFSMANGKSITATFKYDTGASYTIVGLDNKNIALYKDYIENNMVKVEDSIITDATNTNICVYSLEVYDFHLTNEIIIPKITIFFSKDLGDKCILGLDILSLFEFVYQWEKGQLIGTFWIRNYDVALERIDKYFSVTNNTSPRTVLLVDEEVAIGMADITEEDEYDVMSREELITENRRLKSINSGLMATKSAVKDDI